MERGKLAGGEVKRYNPFNPLRPDDGRKQGRPNREM